MEPNPILKEVWSIKDEIARRADYDIQKLCAQTREWVAKHISSPPLHLDDVHNLELDANSSVLRENFDNSKQRSGEKPQD